MNRLRRSGRLLAVLAVPFLAAACSDDDDAVTGPGEVGIAQVRVVHLSPDAPAVDVAVNGEVAVAGAAYLDATGYLPVPAGDVRITVTPAGDGALVTYDADLSLPGPLRLGDHALRPAFQRIGGRAERGMRAALTQAPVVP